MNEAIETIEYEGHTIKLYLDEYPDCNPREWDNLGTIYTPPLRRYKIADQVESTEWISEHINQKNVVALPVYMYDHGGIALSTGNQYPFNCPWDSGQVGYIAVTREKAYKDYGRRVNRKTIEKHLRSEIEVYSSYLQGEVYGYRVFNSEGEDIDGCWGYIGTGGVKCAIEDAKAVASIYAKEAREAVRMERECFAI